MRGTGGPQVAIAECVRIHCTALALPSDPSSHTCPCTLPTRREGEVAIKKKVGGHHLIGAPQARKYFDHVGLFQKKPCETEGNDVSPSKRKKRGSPPKRACSMRENVAAGRRFGPPFPY